MEPKVFKCEGGFCTNKACSYSTPALPDVTSDDWSLIFLYLERHDRILDQRLPFTSPQPRQSSHTRTGWTSSMVWAELQAYLKTMTSPRTSRMEDRTR